MPYARHRACCIFSQRHKSLDPVGMGLPDYTNQEHCCCSILSSCSCASLPCNAQHTEIAGEHMWAASGDWLARGASRAHREISARHRHRLVSETDASSGLRSLLHTSTPHPEAQSTLITGPMISPRCLMPPSPMSTATARVRSLAAAFEPSSSPSSLSTAAAADFNSDDCSDSEPDVAVLVAARSGVKQLTATWEFYSSSAGGSAAPSGCSSPTPSFSMQHQKPISRPVTPAAAPANPGLLPVPSSSGEPAAAAAAAVVAASGAAVEPAAAAAAAAVVAPSRVPVDPAAAAAALMCWRQESGQLGPMLDLLVSAPPAAAGAGAAGGAAGIPGLLAGAAVDAGAAAASDNAAAVQQEPSEELGSAICKVAVMAGLGYYLLTVA